MKKNVSFNSNYIQEQLLPHLNAAIKDIEEAYMLIERNSIPNSFLRKDQLLKEKDQLYLIKNSLNRMRAYYEKASSKVKRLNEDAKIDIEQLDYFRIIEKK